MAGCDSNASVYRPFRPLNIFLSLNLGCAVFPNLRLLLLVRWSDHVEDKELALVLGTARQATALWHVSSKTGHACNDAFMHNPNAGMFADEAHALMAAEGGIGKCGCGKAWNRNHSNGRGCGKRPHPKTAVMLISCIFRLEGIGSFQGKRGRPSMLQCLLTM